MQLGWSVLAVGMAISQGAWAEDVMLEGVEVRSREECLDVLAEFSRICRDFDRPEWIRVTGSPYWNVADILFYRYDIDADGLDDAIISTRAPGARCPRGGELCEHIVIFGGAEIPPKTRQLRTTMWGFPVLATQNGQSGLYFSRSPQTFRTLLELREEVLAGPYFEP